MQWATPSDQPALLRLFEQVFGAQMPTAEWAWKYPAIGGLSLLARRDTDVVAHYGGQPRRLLGLGAPLSAVQVSDIMVDASGRGALARRGLFAHIASAFTEAVTLPRGEHAFVFGFPSPRASRLGELLGLYARMDQLHCASWEAREERPSGRALSLAVLHRQADALWQQQAAALAAAHLLGVRDGAWVSRRYLSHPSGAYRAWSLGSRWWRRTQAVAVYREHADALELLDLLGAPTGYPALIEALRALAGRRGKARLFTWATNAVLLGLPPSAEKTPLLTVNLAGPRCHAQAACFGQRCWMMAGDTDYR